MGFVGHPSWAFSVASGTLDDAVLVRRIRQAYRLACDTFRSAATFGDSQWSIINDAKAAAHETLMHGDQASAATLLRLPCSSNFFHGFDSLVATHTDAVRSSPHQQSAEAYQISVAIRRLAESVGAARIPNPEAPPDHPRPLDSDIEILLSRTETATGMKLSFPNPFPDEFGIETTRGIASLRAPFAIYQAYRLKQAVHGSSRREILEIGAGLGRTAFYAVQGGLSRYTIIDLPLANAAQAYFLGRTIGEDRIALVGEAPRADAVNILPPSSLTELSKVGVVLNVDSLTEMDRPSAEAYVKFARDRAGRFISINHEVNPFTANEIIRSVWPKCILMRYRHPMRDGYVEEIASNPWRQPQGWWRTG